MTSPADQHKRLVEAARATIEQETSRNELAVDAPEEASVSVDDSDESSEDEGSDASDLADFVVSGDEEDDVEPDQSDAVLTFFNMQLFDTMLRGRRWNGRAFVDADGVNDAPFSDYMNRYCADEYAPVAIFLDDHATRLADACQRSPLIASYAQLLDNALSFEVLEPSAGDYRHILIVYDDTATVGGGYRHHYAEVKRAPQMKALLYAVWFLANLRIAARTFVGGILDMLSPATRVACTNIYDLVEAVLECNEMKYVEIVDRYADMWARVDEVVNAD